MGRAMVLIWACYYVLLGSKCVNCLGVNWGTQASTPLDPKYIVQMLKDNKIMTAGLGNKIKATITQNADVYYSGSQGPSAGDFRTEIRDTVVKISRFLDQNNCPFMVNIYPFLSLYENQDFPIEFALFDGGGKGVHDQNIQYTNMLDANLDTLSYCLKKAGVNNVIIIIGEIGWPTNGNKEANVKMAENFYNGLLKKLAMKKGTPLHPGYIEVYLFSLTDENKKSIAPGFFERHWGIFRYDGQPKFPIDFSGEGNAKMPVGAKHVKYLSHQWCVLNDDMKNLSRVKTDLDFACSLGDCTSLSYGSTCNKLSERKNVSYLFNMYFQMSQQSVEACDFNEAAKITNNNYSTA
ncbi:hypothetical protein L1987_53003 [Smallanthus sonchifolius]|uniref:Uncharacterized protein n=1 Tax=Smallanthus sonchifolius TaxID=185202 RepID=A0ACB9EV26_9ASTR|nr:hypothetical protein L1987_53003 [Smallanthus sonchifolius]